MCCSYYDRLLIMGDDMYHSMICIIAMNRLVIMHDQRHIHVIMNIIVNPSTWSILARREKLSVKLIDKYKDDNKDICLKHSNIMAWLDQEIK